jgi:maltooligosyltrehalose trehalohydrolase
MGLLARAYRDGYAYTGQYSAYRQRRHGNSPHLNRAEQFVVCTQNHDQVGNRMLGERLSALVTFEELKLAAGVILLSPYLPLLFMGEEYAETAPFLYFTSHGDPDLIAAVRRGRAEGFGASHARGAPPDPNETGTFLCSKLNHDLRNTGKHRALWQYYRELIRLRTTDPALAHLSKDNMEVQSFEAEQTIVVRRWAGQGQALTAIHFGEAGAHFDMRLAPGRWTLALSSTDPAWGGPGASVSQTLDSPGQVAVSIPPKALVVYTFSEEATP